MISDDGQWVARAVERENGMFMYEWVPLTSRMLNAIGQECRRSPERAQAIIALLADKTLTVRDLAGLAEDLGDGKAEP